MDVMIEILKAVDVVQARLNQEYLNGLIKDEIDRKVEYAKEHDSVSGPTYTAGKAIRALAIGLVLDAWRKVMNGRDHSVGRMIHSYAEIGIPRDMAWNIVDAWTEPPTTKK